MTFIVNGKLQENIIITNRTNFLDGLDLESDGGDEINLFLLVVSAIIHQSIYKVFRNQVISNFQYTTYFLVSKPHLSSSIPRYIHPT